MRFSSKNILQWYKKNGRDLPWRRTRDPYSILVSEIMLQQTQVERVIPYYQSWLESFPNWKSLARASNAQVIRAWSGLGYNRRALVLRDIARLIVKGRIPKSRQEWLSFKGVGPYTASAVSLFSGTDRQFPIDTNTRRVMGRLLLKKFFPQKSGDQQIEKIGNEILCKEQRPGDLVQAMFDLANAHCKKVPDCGACPMRSVCSSSTTFLRGNVITPKRMSAYKREKHHLNKRYPDRIYRGRILKLVTQSRCGVSISSVGTAIDPTFNPKSDNLWIQNMVQRLKKDGLVKIAAGRLRLP